MSTLAELASQLEKERNERAELERQLTHHRTPRAFASKAAREKAAAEVEQKLFSINVRIRSLEKTIWTAMAKEAGYTDTFSAARDNIGKHCVQLVSPYNCQRYMGILLNCYVPRGAYHAGNYASGYRFEFQNADGSKYNFDTGSDGDFLFKFSNIPPVLERPCQGSPMPPPAAASHMPHMPHMPAPSAPPANWRSLIDPRRPYNLPRRMMNATAAKSRRQRKHKQRKFTRKM